MKRLLFLAFLALTPVNLSAADSDYAYFGMGSAITYGCYGVTKSAFHLNEDETWQARAFCGLFTGAVILVTAARDESVKKGNAIGYGAAGTISALGFSYAFKF